MLKFIDLFNKKQLDDNNILLSQCLSILCAHFKFYSTNNIYNEIKLDHQN